MHKKKGSVQSYELQVTSYELRVTSYELQVKSRKCHENTIVEFDAWGR